MMDKGTGFPIPFISPMKPESIVLAVAGVFFGVLVGWVIGSQQAGSSRLPAPAAVAQPVAQSPTAAPAGQTARQLNEAQVQSLEAAAHQNPGDVGSRVQLGNVYFDAERFQDAARWYEEALKLAPKDVNVSTDLGVAYYSMSQADRALAQFEYSLKVDPKHAKTLLNQGIVRAFGKQDLQGAAASWQKVIEVAPNSEEAATAKRALDGLKSAHPNVGGSPSGATPGQ
jgi:cytochrome c-type biogenesis protein CcmH/NrfG